MHENPNTQEFLKNTQALRMTNGTCMDTVKKRSSSMTQEELVKESNHSRREKGPGMERALLHPV